jgi:hypothetical protein
LFRFLVNECGADIRARYTGKTPADILLTRLRRPLHDITHEECNITGARRLLGPRFVRYGGYSDMHDCHFVAEDRKEAEECLLQLAGIYPTIDLDRMFSANKYDQTK